MNYALWYIIGKEKIKFEDGYLLIVKTNYIFSFKKKYLLREIKEIRRQYLKANDQVTKIGKTMDEIGRAFPFWNKMGQIQFEYKRKNVTVLNGLRAEEIDEMIEIILKEIR
jgi:hypothetical protein